MTCVYSYICDIVDTCVVIARLEGHSMSSLCIPLNYPSRIPIENPIFYDYYN